MPRKLSVVQEGTQAPKKPPATIKAAVELSEREFLVATRSHVASVIDAGVPAHALSPLTNQLRQLDREIRTLDAREAEEAQHSAISPDETWEPEAL